MSRAKAWPTTITGLAIIIILVGATLPISYASHAAVPNINFLGSSVALDETSALGTPGGVGLSFSVSCAHYAGLDLIDCTNTVNSGITVYFEFPEYQEYTYGAGTTATGTSGREIQHLVTSTGTHQVTATAVDDGDSECQDYQDVDLVPDAAYHLTGITTVTIERRNGLTYDDYDINLLPFGHLSEGQDTATGGSDDAYIIVTRNCIDRAVVLEFPQLGTATDGTHYDDNDGDNSATIVQFLAGDFNSQPINVDVFMDGANTGTLTIDYDISNFPYISQPSKWSTYWYDYEDIATLSVATSQVMDENDLTPNIVITREPATYRPANVKWSYDFTGTATNGADITATAGSTTLAPGQKTFTVPISGIDDNLEEGAEDFAILIQQFGGTEIDTVFDANGAGLLPESGTAGFYTDLIKANSQYMAMGRENAIYISNDGGYTWWQNPTYVGSSSTPVQTSSTATTSACPPGMSLEGFALSEVNPNFIYIACAEPLGGPGGLHIGFAIINDDPSGWSYVDVPTWNVFESFIRDNTVDGISELLQMEIVSPGVAGDEELVLLIRNCANYSTSCDSYRLLEIHYDGHAPGGFIQMYDRDLLVPSHPNALDPGAYWDACYSYTANSYVALFSDIFNPQILKVLTMSGPTLSSQPAPSRNYGTDHDMPIPTREWFCAYSNNGQVWVSWVDAENTATPTCGPEDYYLRVDRLTLSGGRYVPNNVVYSTLVADDCGTITGYEWVEYFGATGIGNTMYQALRRHDPGPGILANDLFIRTSHNSAPTIQTMPAPICNCGWEERTLSSDNGILTGGWTSSDQVFLLGLTDPWTNLGNAAGVVVIEDDDPRIELSTITTDTVSEGGNLEFTLTRTTTTDPLSISFEYEYCPKWYPEFNNKLTASDFTTTATFHPMPQRIEFPAAVGSINVQIPTVNDGPDEGDESICIILTENAVTGGNYYSLFENRVEIGPLTVTDPPVIHSGEITNPSGTVLANAITSDSYIIDFDVISNTDNLWEATNRLKITGTGDPVRIEFSDLTGPGGATIDRDQIHINCDDNPVSTAPDATLSDPRTNALGYRDFTTPGSGHKSCSFALRNPFIYNSNNGVAMDGAYSGTVTLTFNP